MSIVDKVKGFFYKKLAKKISDKVAKEVGPKVAETLKKDETFLPKIKEKIAGKGGLDPQLEDEIKGEISGTATEMVQAHMESVEIPPEVADLKDTIIEASIEGAVDGAFDGIKDSLK